MAIYGYARISTSKQNIERQVTNITRAYPTAVIKTEAFTGTKISRPEFDKLLKTVKAGDTIVFDSVSRMSRNAEEGFETYMELYRRGIELVFLKEPTINTAAYRSTLKNQLDSIETGDKNVNELLDGIMTALEKYMQALARIQIRLAFEQAEKEVQDLHQRTAEGIREARANGKQIGRAEGAKVTTHKQTAATDLIRKYSKDFGGKLNDIEVMAMLKGQGVSLARNSYYKYKRALSCTRINENAPNSHDSTS